MGKWPLTWVQNKRNHEIDPRTGWAAFHDVEYSNKSYKILQLSGAKRHWSTPRDWFCWWFNKIKLSLRPQYRAEATVLLPWSKSAFPCLSAVVAVINAPAVHFKQDLQEKHREKQSSKKREKRNNLCSCRIFFLLLFPKTPKFWNETTAFSLFCTKGQQDFNGKWLILKCRTMCKVLH